MPPPRPRPRRPPAADVRTQRCRFENERGQRCRRLATVGDGLCRQHALVIELQLEGRASEVAGEIDRFIARQPPGSPLSLLAQLASGVLGRAVAGHQQRYPLPTPHRPGQIPRDQLRCDPVRGHGCYALHGPLHRCGCTCHGPQTRTSSSPRPPTPDPTVAARAILGFEPTETLTRERIQDRKRDLAKVFHPDRAGGSLQQMQRVNAAADTLFAKLP
jgi:hypothetical protein